MGNQRVVVVTGASAGVGRATAVAFARRGAKIGLLARGRAGLEGARREVESAGGRVVSLPFVEGISTTGILSRINQIKETEK